MLVPNDARLEFTPILTNALHANVAAVKAVAADAPPVVPADDTPCTTQYLLGGNDIFALESHSRIPDIKFDTWVEANGNDAEPAGAVDAVNCEVPVAFGTLYECRIDRLFDAAPIEPCTDMDKPTDVDV